MGEPPHTVLMTERFTDDELAFLRHVRFGDLPERVLPDSYVELAESDSPRVLQEVERPSIEG